MEKFIYEEPNFGSFFIIQKENTLKEEYLVVGSKGDSYTITKDYKGNYRCSCKGFQFRGRCSHISRFLNKKINVYKSIQQKINDSLNGRFV